MSYQTYVGLRISTQAGVVPTPAQIGEGELAFNLADGRIFALLSGEVVDITDHYTQEQVDNLVSNLSQRLDALAIDNIAGLWEALAGKVNKAAGKALSTNDYTSDDRERVAALGSMANRNIHVAQRAPTPSDGANGDIWFQY